jgi:hypothetical protein
MSFSMKLIGRRISKGYVVVIVYLFVFHSSAAQKPLMDTSAYGKLPGPRSAYLSDNGEYLYYEGDGKKGNLFSIKGNRNAWVKDISDVNSGASFANGGLLLITKCGQDSLCLQNTDSDGQVRCKGEVG